MASEFFCKQREGRLNTAGCVNKMAVSVTGPRAVKELGGPVISYRVIFSLKITITSTTVYVVLFNLQTHAFEGQMSITIAR